MKAIWKIGFEINDQTNEKSRKSIQLVFLTIESESTNRKKRISVANVRASQARPVHARCADRSSNHFESSDIICCASSMSQRAPCNDLAIVLTLNR